MFAQSQTRISEYCLSINLKGGNYENNIKDCIDFNDSFAVIIVSIGATSKKMPMSGFLTDYSLLKEDPEGLVQWKYFKDGANFGAYDKVIIDHATFFFKEDADYKGIHPDELTGNLRFCLTYAYKLFS